MLLSDTAEMRVPEPTVQFRLEESGRLGRLPPVQNCFAPGVCPLEAVLVTPGIAVKPPIFQVAEKAGAGELAGTAEAGNDKGSSRSTAAAGEGITAEAAPPAGQVQQLLSAQLQKDPGSRAAMVAMQKLDMAVEELVREVRVVNNCLPLACVWNRQLTTQATLLHLEPADPEVLNLVLTAVVRSLVMASIFGTCEDGGCHYAL
jgi:hypothetical protein